MKNDSDNNIKKSFILNKFPVHACRTRIIYFIIYLFIASIAIFTVHHNESFYHKMIGKIETIQNVKSKDSSIQQTLTVKIQNGKEKGKLFVTFNSYTNSRVKSEKYQKGEELFLEKTRDARKNGIRILSFKRDAYAIYLILILTGLSILLIGKRGFRILLSLLGNMLLFMLNIFLYSKGFHLGLLTCFLMIAQTIFTLCILDGLNQKVFLTIVSTLFTIGIVFLIYRIVIAFTNEVPYYMFDYLSVSDDEKRNLFMASVLLGGLGAVMDVAITICSMAQEIKRLNENIEISVFLQTLEKTGYDIIGTMQSVLLFSYLASAIPMMVMKLASGAYLVSVLKFDFSFELVRFLTGAIGIVLAVTVSMYFSAFIFFAWGKKQPFSFLVRMILKEKNNKKKIEEA